MFKRCGRCQNTLSADEFGVDRSTADKLTSYCLLCKRGLNHEYYVKNRAQINERDRKSYQESKANKGKNHERTITNRLADENPAFAGQVSRYPD